jgi:hypothetical protein
VRTQQSRLHIANHLHQVNLHRHVHDQWAILAVAATGAALAPVAFVTPAKSCLAR